MRAQVKASVENFLDRGNLMAGEQPPHVQIVLLDRASRLLLSCHLTDAQPERCMRCTAGRLIIPGMNIIKTADSQSQRH
jgi:hypothetical protein